LHDAHRCQNTGIVEKNQTGGRAGGQAGRQKETAPEGAAK